VQAKAMTRLGGKARVGVTRALHQYNLMQDKLHQSNRKEPMKTFGEIYKQHQDFFGEYQNALPTDLANAHSNPYCTLHSAMPSVNPSRERKQTRMPNSSRCWRTSTIAIPTEQPMKQARQDEARALLLDVGLTLLETADKMKAVIERGGGNVKTPTRKRRSKHGG
jgi:hypothetical protein